MTSQVVSFFVLKFFATLIQQVAPHGILQYDYPNLQNISSFQFEVQAVPGFDHPGTYYVGLQFNQFGTISPCYFGMSIEMPPKAPSRKIVFSCWHDPQRGKLSSTVNVGPGVVAYNFTGEGDGIHTHYNYNWASGAPQNFLVTADEDKYRKGFAIFSAWYRLNYKWMFIASIRKYSVHDDGKFYLIRPRMIAFIENFDRSQASYWQIRKGLYGCQFFIEAGTKGPWREITSAYTSFNEGLDRSDYGVIQKVEGSYFVMQIDGHTKNSTPYMSNLRRTACSHLPY